MSRSCTRKTTARKAPAKKPASGTRKPPAKKKSGAKKPTKKVAVKKLAPPRKLTTKPEAVAATPVPLALAKETALLRKQVIAALDELKAKEVNEIDIRAKVILKPTDFKADEISLGANRFGGQSLFGQADMYNAGYATSAIASMGLGDFTPIELQKMLAGRGPRRSSTCRHGRSPGR